MISVCVLYLRTKLNSDRTNCGWMDGWMVQVHPSVCPFSAESWRRLFKQRYPDLPSPESPPLAHRVGHRGVPKPFEKHNFQHVLGPPPEFPFVLTSNHKQ